MFWMYPAWGLTSGYPSGCLVLSALTSMSGSGFVLSVFVQVLDKEGQMDNPCSSWLSDSNWDNITELDKLAHFHGLMTSFEEYPRDWNVWYTSPEPESAPLPGNSLSLCICVSTHL